MKSKIAVSLLVIALAAALMGGATFAYFTSQATNEGNVFSTGTLQISITDPVEEAIFNVGNMYPGQPTVTDYIYVKNDGTLPMKFWGSVTDAGVGALDAAYLPDKLNVVIKLKGVDPGTGVFDSRDQVIYTGTLADLIDRSATADTSPLKWNIPEWPFGAGWEAKYEIAISFDPNADNSYQGKSFTGTLTFYANQLNDPAWGLGPE